MSVTSKLVQWLFGVGLVGIALFLFSLESLTIPSSTGISPNVVEGLGVYLIACLPLSFGVTIMLSLAFPDLPKPVGGTIIGVGILAFSIGYIGF